MATAAEAEAAKQHAVNDTLNPLEKAGRQVFNTNEKGILLTDTSRMGLRSVSELLPSSAKNNKTFDIVNDYPWTLTPHQNRKGVPYIELTEFEIDSTALWAQIRYWLLGTFNTSDEIGNPYKDLYHATPTGYSFILPYFESYDHSIQPSWEKFKSPVDVGGVAGAIVGSIAKLGQLLGAAPGSIINQPQVFKGSTAASYQVKFTLYNTTGNNWDIKNNMNFKRRLQMATLHAQMSRFFISPPAIFEVLIPGIRYSPAAFISQLNVNNVGQMNLMQINSTGNPENVPDGYEFEIMITELINESRELLHSEYSANMGLRPNITAIVSNPKAIEKFKNTGSSSPTTDNRGATPVDAPHDEPQARIQRKV